MKNLSRIMILSLVAVCYEAYGASLDTSVIINQVSVIPESAPIFTTNIELVPKRNISNWKLGFFMFQVFTKPSLQLNMQICDKASLQCANLVLERNLIPRSLADIESADMTNGHITILKPAARFDLYTGHSYRIQIKGLKNIPQNISMMPQGFFLLENNNTLPLAVNKYVSNAYNESSIQLAEDKLITSRWAGNTNPASPLVPLPQHIQYSKGFLTLESQIKIINSFGRSAGAYYLSRQIQKSLVNDGVSNSDTAKITLNIFNCDAHPVECEKLNDNPEGYRLEIKPQGINIYAIDNPGLFYGYQSLLQLLYYYGRNLPLQEIIDYPEYKYRGLMLDVSRHYFTTTQIKQIVDVMAMHKLNTLHLHLADDEAWRIALSKYPELTRQSGIRYQGYKIGPSNLIDSDSDISNTKKNQYENAATQYQGIYTTQAILDLISYANLQGVKIIPEVEMPGHARSLKKALPKLYDFSNPVSYLSIQGYNDNVLPIYKYGIDENFTNTINGITTDVANLFSGQFIVNNISHEVSLSGDEVPFGSYPESASVATTSQEFFMKLSENLEDYRISGWQQMVQNDDGTIGENVIKPDHVGHIWAWIPVENRNGVSGMEMAKQLLEQEYPVVADFADYAYLDIRYSQKFMEPGLYWSTPYVDTWKTFMLGRQVAPLKAEYKTFSGVEGALWTELIPGQEHLWYMLLPKLSGIAEAGWSNPQTDNWEEFSQRLGCGNKGFLNYIATNAKVNYRGYPSGMALELPATACVKGK